MEKESSAWQLQGQPTVLLTLAHIFHHFAPLLVRSWQGREEGGHADASMADAGAHVRPIALPARVLYSHGLRP